VTVSELEDFLHRTIADRQLSGGEKSAFAEWLANNAQTEQERGVVRHTVFEMARSVSASLDTAQLLEWLEETIKVVLPISPAKPNSVVGEAAQAFFSPGLACLEQLVHRFTTVRKSIDICVFTITDDRITRAILDAHRRHVTIRIITDNDKAFDLGSDAQQLKGAGIPVKIDGTPEHMHHKFAIFDGARLINGSYNWTRTAADLNAENIIDTGDPELVKAFADEFQRLWKVL
jgi:mitochondrial cardiolipin hydrolase